MKYKNRIKKLEDRRKAFDAMPAAERVASGFTRRPGSVKK